MKIFEDVMFCFQVKEVMKKILFTPFVGIVLHILYHTFGEVNLVGYCGQLQLLV